MTSVTAFVNVTSGAHPAYVSITVAWLPAPRRIRLRGYAIVGTSRAVETKTKWIGSSPTGFFGTSTKGPATEKAVFHATNGASWNRANRARDFSRGPGSWRSTFARGAIRTPSRS